MVIYSFRMILAYPQIQKMVEVRQIVHGQNRVHVYMFSILISNQQLLSAATKFIYLHVHRIMDQSTNLADFNKET